MPRSGRPVHAHARRGGRNAALRQEAAFLREEAEEEGVPGATLSRKRPHRATGMKKGPEKARSRQAAGVGSGSD